MKKTTLYQKDSRGNVKIWTLEVIDHGKKAEILTHDGIQGGKMTPNSTFVTTGLNLGKANATTYLTQAYADAQSKIDVKTRKGYVEDINQIKASNILGSGVKEPMLAKKFDPTGKQSSSKTLKQIGIENKTIMVQRKKDGNRCNIHVTKTTVQPYTRKGDKFPTNGLEHITDSVLKSFNKIYDYVNKKYGVTEYWLDGELYTKAFSFNKLNGLAKKEKKDAQDLKDCKEIVYHLYDIYVDAGYETRYKIIQNFKSSAVWVEQAYEITATDANLKSWLEKFLEEGEEGLMIRQLGVPYEHKRSWQLCKYKVFEDAEFVIAGFEESIKGGMAGNVICKLSKPCFDKDGNKIEFVKPGLKFSHEECIEFWNNQSKYIGKKATVEYFGVSEYGVPRFPKAVKIDRIDA